MNVDDIKEAIKEVRHKRLLEEARVAFEPIFSQLKDSLIEGIVEYIKMDSYEIEEPQQAEKRELYSFTTSLQSFEITTLPLDLLQEYLLKHGIVVSAIDITRDTEDIRDYFGYKLHTFYAPPKVTSHLDLNQFYK